MKTASRTRDTPDAIVKACVGYAEEGSVSRDKESDGRTRWIVAGVIVVLLLIFVAQNSEKAHINFLFFDHDAAVWFVIVVSAVLGFVAGWLVGRSRR